MPEDSFKEFVLDQLNVLPEVRAKSMFGAYGLYCGDRFFGILDGGRLYFKTNEHIQADYHSFGMKAFSYVKKGKVMTMGFHEVPPDILENAQELAIWAQKSIAIATVKRSKKY